MERSAGACLPASDYFMKFEDLSQKEIDEISKFIHQYLKYNYSTFYNNPNERDDLVQEAFISVWKAYPSFNPDIATYKAYFAPYIRDAVKRHRIFLTGETGERIRISDNVAKAKKKLEEQGYIPTPDAVSYVTGSTVTLAAAYINPKESTISIDDEELSNKALKDAAYGANPEKIVENKELLNEAKSIIARLSEPERESIKEYIDYLDEDKQLSKLPFTKRVAIRQAQLKARILRDGFDATFGNPNMENSFI